MATLSYVFNLTAAQFGTPGPHVPHVAMVYDILLTFPS